MRSPLAVVRGRSPTADAQPPAWPEAVAQADTFRVGDQLCGGFELAPLNLELMADAEREATLDNLAALYDAIPGPFQLLSVPTDRTPAEHITAIKPTVDGSGERVFRPYVAAYHEISATPTRPPRRTILVVDAPGDTISDLGQGAYRR